MVSAERFTIFGDTNGMRAKDIRSFVNATNNSYGGSYPDCQGDLAVEEVIERTRELLTEAGILGLSPIIPCHSPEEKVRRILQNCRLRSKENGTSQFWIIDRNPQSIVGAAKNIQPNILRFATVVKLGLGEASDRFDPATGIRLVTLPPSMLRFPFHPTPAS